MFKDNKIIYERCLKLYTAKESNQQPNHAQSIRWGAQSYGEDKVHLGIVREASINHLSKSIDSRRTEMKQLSRQVNNIIEKQNKKPQKEGPSHSLHHYSTSKMKKLHKELEK